MESIETIYNGYKFRSRLEARWAIFFDAVGIKYEYEPEGIRLTTGDWYLPDFYLPQFHCYFEVKRIPKKFLRSELPTEEFGDAIAKISNGAHGSTWAGIIAFGDPYDHYMWIFCQEVNDGSGGSYENPVVFGEDPETGQPMLFAWWDYRDRDFFDSWENYNKIPMRTDCNYMYLDNPFLTNRVIEAELKARQARFEHGEKG